MREERKTKSELIDDLHEARRRIEVLERVVEQYDSTENGRFQIQGDAAGLYEQLPLSCQSVDEKARMLYVNSAWTKLMGYSRVQVIGRSYFDFVAPEEHESLKDDFHAFKANGEIHNIERTLIRADGSRLVVVIDGNVTRDASGGLRMHCVLKDITSQRQTEAKLRESASNFRSLIESIEAVFWVSTPGVTELLYVSPAYEKMWGRPTTELFNMPRAFVSSIHPDDKDGYLSVLEEYHAQGKSYGYEYRIIKPDGQLRWIRERGYPIKSTTDGKLLMKGICTDITKQKQSELDLRRNRERLAWSQRIARIGSWDWNVVAGTLDWSEEAYRIYGVPPQQKPSHELVRSRIHPGDLEFWEQSVQEAVERGIPKRIDYRLLFPGGSVRWVHNEMVVELDAEGKASRFIGTVQDITERKQVEEALAESERRYRLVSENLPVVLYSNDPGRRFINVFATGPIEKLTGYTREELVEDPGLFVRIVHPEDRKRVVRQIIEQRRSRTTLDVEFRIVTKQGDVKWIRDRAVPNLDENGVIDRIDGIVEDVTTKKAVEQELVRSRAELKAIYEHAPVMMCTLDTERRVVYANGAFTKFTGVSEAELHNGCACGVFGCINAMEDPRGCGFGPSCLNCLLRQAIEDTLQTGRPHRDVEYRATLEREADRREVAMLACTSRIPAAEQALVLLCLHDITARVRAEEAARASAQELKLTLDATTDGIWEWDLRTGEIYFSPRYYTMLGYKPGEFPPSYDSWASLLHPEDRERALGVVSRYFETKPDVYENEYRLRTKEGKYRWIHTRAHVVERNEKGEAVRMIGNHHDITDFRLAEAALRLSERRLQRAQAVAKIGSWEWHPATGETFWSDQHYRLFGLEPGETDTSYELVRRFVHQDDLALWEAAVANAIESGDRFRCEYRAIRTDGEEIWVHNEAEITRDQKGKPVLFFGTAQDITERHRTIESLKERNREFELIFNSVPAMIFLKDTRRRHVKVNRALIEATGVAESEWNGRTIGEILPKLARGYDRVDREVLRSGKGKLGFLERYESAQGIRWSRTNKIPVRDRDGNVCGLVGFGIDVTEVLQAQNELKERLFELENINRFVIRSTRLRTVDSLSRLAASAVRRLIRGAFVLVSFYDPAVGGPRLRAVAGLGKSRAEISGLLKAEPEAIWGRVKDMGEQARAHAAVFTSGRLEEVPGGFVTLCDGMIPRETSERIATFLGIEKVYTVGLTLDKRILGGLSLLLPAGQELHHQNTVEIIARHLSVVLNRLLGEEDLRNSHLRFRQLARRISGLLENQSVTIARELHDDLGQSLTAVAMDLALLDEDLKTRPEFIEQLAGTIGDMRSLLHDCLDKVKDLSHVLRPTILDTAGIVEALQWQLVEFGRRSGIEVKLQSQVQVVDLDKEQSVAVFRCVQEALTNCARHSRARNVEMTIRKQKIHLVVRVKDDGVGFDSDQLDPFTSLGLLGLQEHAAACGGSAEIHSLPGMGTTVAILVPLEGKR